MSPFLLLVTAIVKRDLKSVVRSVSDTPALAAASYRRDAKSIFYDDIRHYMYGDDTALHIAAAAFSRPIAEVLIAHGADVRAKNRRGAEPLHYAADANCENAEAQAETIRFLISAGADPNALDRSGVAPLHRAVRTRSVASVRALIDGGADFRLKNRSGSTPLFLSRHNTGRGGSGSDAALAARATIEALLIDHGAR